MIYGARLSNFQFPLPAFRAIYLSFFALPLLLSRRRRIRSPLTPLGCFCDGVPQLVPVVLVPLLSAVFTPGYRLGRKKACQPTWSLTNAPVPRLPTFGSEFIGFDHHAFLVGVPRPLRSRALSRWGCCRRRAKPWRWESAPIGSITQSTTCMVYTSVAPTH